MKKTIMYFFISLAFIIASSLLFSAIIAFIKYNWKLDDNFLRLFTNILSLLFFFIGGFLYAYGIKKKAILNAMAFVGLYLIFILMNLSNVTSYLFVVLKGSSYLIGCFSHYLLKTH